MKKNKKAMLALAALAATLVIGGTWAYWSQDLTAVNEFETGKYDSDIVEEFTPPAPGEWVPGVKVEKKVNVVNNGNVKLAAVTSINQVWVRTEDVMATSSETQKKEPVLPLKGDYFDLMFKNASDEFEYASIIDWGEKVVALVTLKDEAAGMGITTTVSGLDDENAAGKWVLVAAENDEKTNKGGQGYSDVKFIYNGIIGKEKDTGLLLEGATLNEEINTTVTSKHTTVFVDEDGSKKTVTETTTNPAYGYDSAKYTMTINATTVQATESAIKDVFGAKGYVEELITSFVGVNKDDILLEELPAETETGV